MGTWNPPGGPTTGDDTFTGNSTGESANGGLGDDTLVGNGDADTLEGGAGSDGAYGGAGDDFIIVRGDIVDSNVVDDVEDDEVLAGGAGIDTLQVQGQVSVYEASVSLSSFERLTFLSNDDLYNALTIRSSSVGPGLSTTLAITGAGGVNLDQITVLSDGVGVDLDLSGWTFSNWTQGRVFLLGDAGGNDLIGTSGRDTLEGRDGADVLRSGLGSDNLLPSYFGIGDGAIDHMYGGGGDDIYGVYEANDIVHEVDAPGFDQVASFINYTLGNFIESVDLRGNVATTASGNALANSVLGNEIANTLYGLDGNDYIDGEQGDDTLYGGSGVDQMLGRAGNDTFYVDDANDLIQEFTGEGTDTIRTQVSLELVANVENLVLLGSAALNGTGNNLNNAITGNGAANSLSGLAGVDTINGGGGNDIINGGVGKDTLTGGGGRDAFVFDKPLIASNVDRITDFSAVDDVIRLDSSVFTGLATGALAASRFVVGAAAADASDRIIYDSATGAVFFDADGVGGAAQLRFATLATGLALTAADFFVT